MLKPDYLSGSIINLVSSLARGMGARMEEVPSLPALAPERVGEFRNIVLFVVDGLGYQYFTTEGQDSVLAAYLKQSITTVFPSTTATAITSLATGRAPLQHGMTGWFMYLDYLDTVTAVLPFVPRGGIGFPMEQRYDPSRAYGFEPVIPCLQRQAWIVNNATIIDTPYSRAISGQARRRAYGDLDGCIDAVVDLVSAPVAEQYIYAYWPVFDGLCHVHGVGSEQVRQHFQELDKQFGRLLDVLQGSNTLLVVTADHGMIDTAPDRLISMQAHPELERMLRLPLCGEPRAAYCYLQPGCQPDFLAYISSELSAVCAAMSSEDMMAQNYFGAGGVAHPDFVSRIGDCVLLPRDNYVVKDYVAGEKMFSQIGVHGGLSAAELLVPLIIVET